MCFCAVSAYPSLCYYQSPRYLILPRRFTDNAKPFQKIHSAALKMVEGMQPKIAQALGQCLWSFTHSSLNLFRVFEYRELDVWRNTPAEQKTEKCFHRRFLFCFLIALATLQCYITAVASVRTWSVHPKTTVESWYLIIKTSNHSASVSRTFTLSEYFCHHILLHTDHSISSWSLWTQKRHYC